MREITHRVAEERSLALHQEVARRLREQPELLDKARERVESWSKAGNVAGFYVTAWQEVLSGTLDDVIDVITGRDERAVGLRQASPFAGVIDPATRWSILRSCEQYRRTK
jgi:hypothetical protein